MENGPMYVVRSGQDTYSNRVEGRAGFNWNEGEILGPVQLEKWRPGKSEGQLGIVPTKQLNNSTGQMGRWSARDVVAAPVCPRKMAKLDTTK